LLDSLLQEGCLDICITMLLGPRLWWTMLLQFLLWSNNSYWVLTQASSSSYIKSNYAPTPAEYANAQLKVRPKRNVINPYKIKTFIFNKISKMAKFIDKTSSNLFPTSSSENQERLPFDENKLVYIGKPKSNLVQHSDYPKALHSVHHTEQLRLPKHSVSHSKYTSKVPSLHHGSAGVISSYVSTTRHASNQQHTSTPVYQSPTNIHALKPEIHSSTTLQVSSNYAKTNMQKPIEASGGYIAAPATPEKPRVVFPFILRNISKDELQLGKVHFPKALSTLWNNSEADDIEYIDEDMDQLVEDIYENNMLKLSKIDVSSDENEAESSVPSNISSRDEILVDSFDSSPRSNIETEDASLPTEQQLSTTNKPKKVVKLGKKNLQTVGAPVTKTTVPIKDQSINSKLSPSQELEDTTKRVVKTYGYLKPKVKKVVKMLDDNSYASDISLKPNYQTENTQEIVNSHSISVGTKSETSRTINAKTVVNYKGETPKGNSKTNSEESKEIKKTTVHDVWPEKAYSYKPVNGRLESTKKISLLDESDKAVSIEELSKRTAHSNTQNAGNENTNHIKIYKIATGSTYRNSEDNQATPIKNNKPNQGFYHQGQLSISAPSSELSEFVPKLDSMSLNPTSSGSFISSGFHGLPKAVDPATHTKIERPNGSSEDRVYFSKTAILDPEFHPVNLPSKINDESTKGRIYFDKNSILPPEFHAFSLPINEDDQEDENASHVKNPYNHHESLPSPAKVEEKEENDVDFKVMYYDEDNEDDSKEYDDDNNEEYDNNNEEYDNDNEEVEYEDESAASAGVLVYLVTDENNPDEPYLVPASVLDNYIH